MSITRRNGLSTGGDQVGDYRKHTSLRIEKSGKALPADLGHLC